MKLNIYRKINHTTIQGRLVSENGRPEGVYEKCCKIHANLGDKTYGCQEFIWKSSNLECAICGCHSNFHRKVVERAPVRYTTEVVCMDGCKEYMHYGIFLENICAACNRHKSFHRNEV
ncbi:hypothetical protein ACJIZ3_020631 [Penstemon smallii]|uniref:ZF-HD dimerization-type domain-containing protein n=1 Tax=Penstemon smallii TaxID=265156 RepID=A0ABD3SJX4_9LAMI